MKIMKLEHGDYVITKRNKVMMVDSVGYRLDIVTLKTGKGWKYDVPLENIIEVIPKREIHNTELSGEYI